VDADATVNATAEATVTEAIARLAPIAATAEEVYAGAFRAIAELLLGRATLYAAGRPHRFTELEMYWSGFAHVDPFTHGDPLQQQRGAWYFHRAGQRYRGGTYKGLDVAFGCPGAYGGILVRGIQQLDGEPLLLDGPCVVVDHLLAATASGSIDELVDELVRRGAISIESPDRRSPLHVALDAEPGRAAAVYATPRIGLTLRKGSTAARRRYLARSYRFLSEPAKIRKGKPHLVVALHREGRAPAEIASLTGTRRSVIEGYVAAFEAGRRRAIAEPGADRTPEEICALLGACAATDE
jgi:hypothetical protein